jgi:hypothetical protein
MWMLHDVLAYIVRYIFRVNLRLELSVMGSA